MPVGVRVLAIDDDERVTRLVVDHLEMRGWACEAAPDGHRGLALAAGGGYDLVLLDLGLPGMDGMSVLRELRRLIPGTPVVLMTGSGTAENAIRAMRHGATDFITKPFHLRTLDEALDRCVQTNGARQEAAAGTAVRGDGASPAQSANDALHRSLSTVLALIESSTDSTLDASSDPSASTSATGTGTAARLVSVVDALARSLALPARDARTLRWAARLTSMPQDVLANLEAVGDAARVARLRHERWDGVGSPHGLRAESIPLASRCLAVGEAVVAGAASFQDWDGVRGTLRASAGTRFDPAVVELCTRLPETLLTDGASAASSSIGTTTAA